MMTKREDDQVAAFMKVANTGHSNVVTGIIGQDRPVLSRRKARRLAYVYRGSSRGKRYAEFLAGRINGYVVIGNRLISLRKFSQPVFVRTVHMPAAFDSLQGQLDSTSYVIEGPTTYSVNPKQDGGERNEP